MRFRRWALLGIFLFLTFCISVGEKSASGQPTQIGDAHSKLDQAFVLVQQADLEGASPDQISLLANYLNLALSYENNATQLFSTNITASNIYASESANLSNTTSTQALIVAYAATAQLFLRQAAVYSVAVAAGFGSALLVLEIHRLRDFVWKLRLRRTSQD